MRLLSWVSAVAVGCFLLPFSAVYAVPLRTVANERPVALLTSDLRARIEPFRGHKYEVEYRRGGDVERRTLAACSDLPQLQGGTGLQVLRFQTIDGLRATAQQCSIAAIVGRLKSSRATFLPNALPVEFVKKEVRCGWIGAGFCERVAATPSHLTWVNDRPNIVIISSPGGWYTSVRLVARGDINGDGIEEFVLDVVTSPDSGKTGVDSSLVLTRRNSRSAVELLERTDESSLLGGADR